MESKQILCLINIFLLFCEFGRKVNNNMRCRSSWPDPSQRNATNSRCLQDTMNKEISANDEENEAILKEDMEEKDDPEHLEQARAMDEYKDMHRRGWGNRANRS